MTKALLFTWHLNKKLTPCKSVWSAQAWLLLPSNVPPESTLAPSTIDHAICAMAQHIGNMSLRWSADTYPQNHQATLKVSHPKCWSSGNASKLHASVRSVLET